MMPELEPLCVEDNVSGCRLKPSALTAPRAPASQTSSLISPCMDTASVHTLYLHHSNATPFLMGHLKSPSNQPALDPVVAMLLRRWQGRPSIVISVSVFSVFMRTSENTGLNYTKFSLHAARGHSHLSSGNMLCTSGFVDDVIVLQSACRNGSTCSCLTGISRASLT